MKILLTGGGTGGHLVIAQSLKDEFIKQGDSVYFAGSNYGQDKKWFENDDDFHQKYFFDTVGVVNKKFIGKISSLWKIFKAFLHVRDIIKKEKIDAVISVGGFSAAPASFAALSLKVPFFIHEQNAHIGKLNQLLKPYAKTFFSSYHDESPIKYYPIKENFFKSLHVREEIKTIIFLGGSQGAKFINDLAMGIADELIKKGIHIIHQCGESDFERVNEFYKKESLHVELYGFCNNMDELLDRADFAISRSGASTLWELCANGVVSLFIPYPYAAADHQYHNAKFLQEQDLAFIKREDENIKDTILSILDIDLKEKSKKLMSLTNKDATKLIIENIKEKI
jgi:UDP-N-acetylglucosamine--N-acetylmuramyl-(pentapeptide) pyrophosphoryl-undecaprenol N-acetylglucosamine transferase